VLSHHDDFGRSNPDLVAKKRVRRSVLVRTVSSGTDVREYCLTLSKRSWNRAIAGVVLEACGPMGIEHAGPHDKSEFAH